MNEYIYCSIDLELSGFDPAKDEILEVGFVLFRLGREGFEVIEEWGQVFKPHREVHHKILGLTGINQKELDAAPLFEDFRDFIVEKIKGTILVGHGLTLDIRFLEAFGVQTPPNPIDTLELVQWLLPTHHSYNLENLMHYFSIPHREAHRALADSRAVIQLLKELLGIYHNLSAKQQQMIQAVIHAQQFSWTNLLRDPDIHGVKIESPIITSPQKQAPIQIEPQSVVMVPYGTSTNSTAVSIHVEEQSIVVLPDKASIVQYWKEGLVSPVFSASDVFDNQKFETLVILKALRLPYFYLRFWFGEVPIGKRKLFRTLTYLFLVRNLYRSSAETSLCLKLDKTAWQLIIVPIYS
jgi:DNA polymerase III epsilon subunit-like protein